MRGYLSNQRRGTALSDSSGDYTSEQIAEQGLAVQVMPDKDQTGSIRRVDRFKRSLIRKKVYVQTPFRYTNNPFAAKDVMRHSFKETLELGDVECGLAYIGHPHPYRPR